MRAFVYLRQSLDRTGSGAAVDRQREDCMQLCAERGWEVVRTYVDNDVSATSRKPRPEYLLMLAAVERGEADVVVAWHVDRLTRKLVELEHLIELAERTGLRIATATGDVDLTTDAGRLVGRILASVARGEVERKGARQRRAQQQAAEQGRPAGGRRAFGYASDGMTVVEVEAEQIRQAYVEVLAGASLKGTARKWNDLGFTTTAGNPWRHDNLRSMLLNPRYAGQRTYRGEVVGPAAWPALIDAETHAAASALLTMPERRTTATTARKYLLPGLARCWKCGSDVATGHTRHGKRVYVCRANKCVSRKAEPVDVLIAGGEWDGEQVRGLVVERLARPDAHDLVTRSNDPAVEQLRSREASIRERLDDLATGLEEGLLTLSAVRRSSDRLRAELSTVEASLRAALRDDVLAPLVDAPDVAAAWSLCSLQRKRAVIDALMSITLDPPERGHNPFDPASVRIEWKS